METRHASRHRGDGFALALLAVTLVAMAVLLGGCHQPPEEIRAALYTAESALNATVEEAKAAESYPWRAPPGETVEDRAARQHVALELWLRMAEQAAANCKAVADYFEAGRLTPLPDEGGGGDGG